MNRGLLLVCLIAAVSTGCIAARGGGGAIAPAQYEMGSIAVVEPHRSETGQRFAGSLNTASFDDNPRARYDVALGYQLESTTGTATSNNAFKATSARPVAQDEIRFIHGPYMHLMTRVAGGKHQRLWVGPTAALLFHGRDGGTGYALSVRTAWELIHASRSRNHRGVLGIGVFAEIGTRRLPNGQSAATVISGLTLRLPAAAAR